MKLTKLIVLSMLFVVVFCEDSSESEESEDSEEDSNNVLEREDCAKGEVQCEDESKCINANYQCDRFFDCPDRSDEVSECGVCGEEDVYCNGTTNVHFSCINTKLICDGWNDCGDMEDERTCRGCGSGFVACTGTTALRTCIRDSWVCDGVDDCGTGQDELNCPP